MGCNAVAGFKPSQNGFRFANWFIDVPYDFKVLGLPIRGGHACNGMCGGMIYTVCDLFYAGLQPPQDRFTPSRGPLFKYLCQRLIDSFALPFGPLQYYLWMNPTVKDALGRHSRAWKMTCLEWPKIKDDIDHDRLCNIGLVLLKSWSPADLGKNHQVLVYGYELEGQALKLMIYDPNAPGDDGASLSISLAGAEAGQPTSLIYANSKGKVKEAVCFFKTDYRFKQPPGLAP